MVAMNVSYFGACIHSFVFLLVTINGAWTNRRFSVPMIAVLVIVASRVVVYAYAHFHPTDGRVAPASTVNASLLSMEVLVSMWHVLAAARVARSKRFVLCTVAAAATATNILVGSGGKESCSFFAPVEYVLVFVCFMLLTRAIRSGGNPYTLHQRHIPIELVAFHFIALVVLMTATVRSDACLGQTSDTGTGAALVLADVFALAPIVIAAWLKMDELLDSDDYDDDEGDGAL